LREAAQYFPSDASQVTDPHVHEATSFTCMAAVLTQATPFTTEGSISKSKSTRRDTNRDPRCTFVASVKLGRDIFFVQAIFPLLALQFFC